MQVPAQIDFQGMSPAPELRQRAEELIGKLETRFGRVTSCRVAIKAPGEHHRTSGLYEVNIEIALPDGRSVTAARTPPADERFRDARFALDEAFKRARRRLQDQARRLRGEVKSHVAPPLATVVSLDRAEGFGFVRTADNRDIYFHRNSVLDEGFDKLEVGARVSFSEEQGNKGPQASTVRLVGKHALRV
jgi:cold shock CspA family protein/ribosome-associated translation inhibitor RaiA